MIAIYRPCEIIRDSDGDMISQIKAVGYCLPTSEKLRYRLNGHWIKHPRHGLQFEVEGYEEVISHTKEGIIGYLASGQIKGVGQRTVRGRTVSRRDLGEATLCAELCILTEIAGSQKTS